MDKPLPSTGNAGKSQDPASSSQSQPRSRLADDMLKAQQDLAAAARGGKMPVDKTDADLQTTPSSPKPNPLPSPPLTKGQPATDDTGAAQPPTDKVAQKTTRKPVTPMPVSGPKEQREFGPTTEPEKAMVTEYKEPEPGPEVKDWMEKLEEGETVQLPQPVTDDYGQVLIQAAGKSKPKIVLPLDEEEVSQGLHHKVIHSMRWLAEWCIRVMKKATGRVFYKPAEEAT